MHIQTPYTHERTTALKALTLASTLARTLQSTQTSPLSKPDTSPVTTADYAIQALIISILHTKFPTDNFIAEESSTALRSNPTLLSAVAAATNLHPNSVLSAIDLASHPGATPHRTWILDPIDGTRGFIAGRQYCIALALIEHGVAQLGILGCPNLPHVGMDVDETVDQKRGILFYAEKGHGTYMLAEEQVDTTNPFSVTGVAQGKPCVVSDVVDPTQANFCESVEKAHSSHELSARVAEILGVTLPPVRMDSQAKYGCMARGDASIFLRFPRGGYVENVWDCAPAAVVIQEAGGRVTDGRGRDLDFGRGRQMDNDDGIVASNGLVHDAVIRAVQQAMRERRAV